MGINRRSREPNLGYLSFDELPYREYQDGQPCAHWLKHERRLTGRRELDRHDDSCSTLAAHGARFDHAHALIPSGGRRLILNQPYMPLGEHLAAAESFAAQWGLEAIPVAYRDLADNPYMSTSAVQLVGAGAEVSDVVARLRDRWTELVPGSTVA